jgi:hypothetical protein
VKDWNSGKAGELYPGKPPAQEERPILREVYQGERKPRKASLQSVWPGGRSSEPGAGGSIPQREGGGEAQGQGGRKTEARIKVSEKNSSKPMEGSRTFQELREAWA